ncbi:hypothetical protein BLA29_003847 [Euroglyphus maynei]|uniref:ABC transporter sub-family G-like protein n=1 Tax=Euroglyphus maynei TaxID=6958 RepID=A0A1Y3B942_EURMA|nr:hypothetical protein BLA29_003847 [Euroglyphus maynei]
MVFKSDILMLDEPTTGVDSVSGYQIMNDLKSLTKRRKAIAILATIHQPSQRIFALFDNLIILSREGSILFQGHPNNLAQILENIGLQCPMYTSLSDYILEVASGDFGKKSLQTLSHYNREMNKNRFTDDFNEVEMNSLREAVKRAHLSDQRSLALCTWLVLWRCFICNYRDPFSLKTRIPSLTLTAIFLILLYGEAVGQVSTCATKYVLWTAKIENILDLVEEQSRAAHENLSILLLMNVVSLFNSMLALMITIPNEIYVFRREYNNYSYTIWTYFVAKTLSEIPFTMITTGLFVLAVHRGTGQIFDHWNRVYFTILPCCLITMIGQFIGMMLGTIFYRSQVQAVFSMSFILVPILVFSGYFKLISQMNNVMVFLSNISFLKPSINSIMIAIYGFDRCLFQAQQELQQILSMNQTRPEWIDSVATLVDVYSSTYNQTELADKTLENEEKLVGFMGIGKSPKDRRAFVLQYWKLSETYDSYYHEIYQLIIYCMILAIMVYLTMFIRLKREKN